MQNSTNAAESGKRIMTMSTGAWTEVDPCRRDWAELGFSFTMSPKVAVMGEEMGRMVSSELVLVLLRRGEEGTDVLGSPCET